MFGDRKKTAGSIIGKARVKQASEKAPHVEELADEMTKDIMSSVNTRIEADKHFHTGDFYIQVLLIVNKVLKVPHNKYESKSACPTPDYDQSVFKYHRSTGALEYLWTIPDRAACFFLIKNKHNLRPDKYDSLSYVLKFQDGTLDLLAKKLNGEILENNIIGKKEWKTKQFQETYSMTLKEVAKAKEPPITLGQTSLGQTSLGTQKKHQSNKHLSPSQANLNQSSLNPLLTSHLGKVKLQASKN